MDEPTTSNTAPSRTTSNVPGLAELVVADFLLEMHNRGSASSMSPVFVQQRVKALMRRRDTTNTGIVQTEFWLSAPSRGDIFLRIRQVGFVAHHNLRTFRQLTVIRQLVI